MSDRIDEIGWKNAIGEKVEKEDITYLLGVINTLQIEVKDFTETFEQKVDEAVDEFYQSEEFAAWVDAHDEEILEQVALDAKVYAAAIGTLPWMVKR